MTRIDAPLSEMCAIASPQKLAVRPDHISFSQLTQLSSAYRLACPRKWAYAKLFDFPDIGAGRSMMVGKALDAGVQSYWRARIVGLSAENAELLAEQSRREALAEMAPKDAMATAAERLSSECLTLFIKEHRDSEPPASVQEEHVFTVRGTDNEIVSVLGYSDYILTDGRIVDLKFSGSPRWDSAGFWQEVWLTEKRMQLTMYAMARHAVLTPSETFQPAKGRLTVLTHAVNRKAPQIRSIDLSILPWDVEAIVTQIREADAIARSGFHPPRPGIACQWCSYTERCRLDLARTALPTEALLSHA